MACAMAGIPGTLSGRQRMSSQPSGGMQNRPSRSKFQFLHDITSLPARELGVRRGKASSYGARVRCHIPAGRQLQRRQQLICRTAALGRWRSSFIPSSLQMLLACRWGEADADRGVVLHWPNGAMSP